MAKKKPVILDRDQWFTLLGWDLLEAEWLHRWARKWANGHVLL